MVTNVPRSQADIFPFSLAEGTAWGYARVRLDCGGASSLTNTIGGRIISQIQTVREHLPDSYIVFQRASHCAGAGGMKVNIGPENCDSTR